MGKKNKNAVLQYPIIHSKFNDPMVEEALTEKARQLLSDDDDVNFILLSGQFFDTRGWAYSALRSWRGAIKPSTSSKKSGCKQGFKVERYHKNSFVKESL